MSGSPEKTMRRVVAECADCDICRFLMDESCRMFPELYRLWDREKETGIAISAKELRHLADLCNYCALCPCPPVRAGILKAKSEFVERDGLPHTLRLMEDVALMGRLCGTWPRLANTVLQSPGTRTLAKRAMGIHRERRLPGFPDENFPAWAKKHGLHHPPTGTGHAKVVYFAGCTASYLYPEVARAAVSLLQAAGIQVWAPPLDCCGMPPLLEGDRRLAASFARKNLNRLARAAEKGFDIVCSCPTCGYVLKEVLGEGAGYGEDGQRPVGTGMVKVPRGQGNGQRHQRVNPLVCGPLSRDQGPFADIDPKKRIVVAENTHDLGHYLLKSMTAQGTTRDLRPLETRAVYYPPCHLREQKIGRPYPALLKGIPGLDLETIDGDLYCCGMAGIMGFKESFHDASVRMGTPLMDRIESLDPQILVTDCLSCRLQFNQMTRRRVRHPLELLAAACCGVDFSGDPDSL